MSRCERVVVGVCGFVAAYYGAHLAKFGGDVVSEFIGCVMVLAGYIGVMAVGISATGSAAE